MKRESPSSSPREPRVARDVEGLLPDLRDTAPHDLADLPRLDPCPLDGPLLNLPQKIGRMDGGECPPASPDRCSGCLDDVHFAREQKRV